jgi:hypothetical protein
MTFATSIPSVSATNVTQTFRMAGLLMSSATLLQTITVVCCCIVAATPCRADQQPLPAPSKKAPNASWLEPSKNWEGRQFARRMIYHSPQTPGYTCWVGAWFMPDKSMMIDFTQNTGPVEGRPRASAEALKKFPMLNERPQRDATGLTKATLFFHSTDNGQTWTKTGEVGFEGPCAYNAPGGQDLALGDGSILKGFFGYFEPATPDAPQTAYLRRSGDMGKTWTEPQPLVDQSKETWRLTRIRKLRDGRLIATGGRSRTPSSSDIATVWKIWEPLLIVSEDNGKTWSPPVEFLGPDQRNGWVEEYDTAELPNGDLLAIFRRRNFGSLLDDSKPYVVHDWGPKPQDQIRFQAILKKSGKTWTLGEHRRADFPHSGHPELLVTREGPILHIATTGIDLT